MKHLTLFAILILVACNCGDDEPTTPIMTEPDTTEIDALQAEIDRLSGILGNGKADPQPETRPVVRITNLPRPINKIVDGDNDQSPPPVVDLPDVVDRVPVDIIQGHGIITYEWFGAIHIVNPDGTDNTFLTNGNAPELSPDRRFVVYSDVVGEDKNDNHIFIMSIDGVHTFQLTDPAIDWNANHPTWSRDGTRIAFTYLGWIYVVDSDGTNLQLITEGGGEHITWSPDMQRIAFTHRNQGDEIYVVNIDGTNNHKLVDSEASHPDWSPSGQRIVFQGYRDSQWNIMIANSEIANEIRGVTEGRQPTWSPDGRRIAFVDNSILCIVNTNGTNKVQLQNVVNVEHPNWR